MESTPTGVLRIRFGEFEADLRTQELRKDGRVLRLPNQSFLVLSMLLQQPGQLVTRDELRKRLWPEDTFVEYDQALNAAVNRLREALGDSAGSPKYIETLPRRGYRFIGTLAPATFEQPDEISSAAVPESAPRTKSIMTRIDAIFLALSVVGLCALVYAMFTLRQDTDMSAPPRLEPFTSLPDREIAPTFSPDGRQLVFAWNGDSQGVPGFDLYLKSTHAEKTLRLTRRPAEWISPAWSPDGHQIALARSSPEDSGIFLIPAPLGGEERRLVTAQFALTPLTQIAWSPDGKRLVYSAFGEQGTQVLYLLPLDSLASSALRPDVQCWDIGSPAFSPDGREIAFVCTTSVAVYSIHTMSVAGGPARKLASVMGYPKGLTWSADGSHIVFANDSGDGGGLWRVDLNGVLSRIPFGEEASMPVASRQGNRIAYVRGHEVIDIWRIDLQAPSPDRSATKLIASTRIQMNPQYSPDGTRIAFQSTRSGSSEIWVVDADGSNPTRISSFNGPLAGAPTWCRDGKRLAFDSRASGKSALYVADIDERRPRLIDTSVENLALPVWSADCQWLIASDGNDASYIVPVAGGAAKRFTTQRSYYASAAGDEIVFNVKGAAGVSLWRKRIDDEQERALERMPTLSYTDAWTAAAGGVYFTLASDDANVVRYYDFVTREIKPVAHLAKAPTPSGGLGLSVSHDSRWMLYTQTEDEQSDIMLMTP
jgi:Tol biopolymer transport system component/DNA-binding winged helix-turn-helix (wHTH) protein